jgi:hypothetical protein
VVEAAVVVAEAVSASVEVVEEAETALVEVEEVVETAPVMVVEEAEPSSAARRHSAQGAHSPRAPPGLATEEWASVEALDSGGTPAPT